MKEIRLCRQEKISVIWKMNLCSQEIDSCDTLSTITHCV